jgi:serine protease Do
MLRFAQALQTLGVFLFASISTSVIAVAAAELNLKGDQFWVVLASRQDIDQAIAVARTNLSSKAMVVRSANGWFATITGPHGIKPGSGRQFLDELAKSQGVPKDAYLTKGAKFIAVIWTPPVSPILDTMQYDGEHDAILRKGDLEIKLSKRLIGDDQSAPVADALYKGKPAFRIELTDNPAEKPESQAVLARLDPESSMPQVVFTYFWQGAHCCTVTKIATLNNEGNWHVIDGGALDGDGYDFEDLDNAGFGYLVSVDQNFLYAFDAYAGSLAPTRIHQLVGDKLIDVTSDPKFQHRLLQRLYSEEDMARARR